MNMPSERFYNLPQHKRERIVEAAYEELSKVSYDKLSINKIIKTAEIPRGSFYEYFDDKDDLLMFLMKNFSEFIESAINRALAEHDGDVFAVVLSIYDKVILYANNSRHRQVCDNIFRTFAPGSDNMEQLLKIRAERCQGIIESEMRSGRYKVKTKEDAVLLWKTLTALLAMGIAKTFANESRSEEIRSDFIRQLDFIRYGVVSVH